LAADVFSRDVGCNAAASKRAKFYDNLVFVLVMIINHRMLVQETNYPVFGYFLWPNWTEK